jgi:hypothetical protein
VEYKNTWVQFQTNIIEQLKNRPSLLTYLSTIYITFSSTMKFSYIALLATGYAFRSQPSLSPKPKTNSKLARSPHPLSSVNCLQEHLSSQASVRCCPRTISTTSKADLANSWPTPYRWPRWISWLPKWTPWLPQWRIPYVASNVSSRQSLTC